MPLIKTPALLISLAILSTSSVQAARIIDTAENKAVNNVHWHKIENINAQLLLNRAIPDNKASLFFLRRADQDSLQTSANIAINDRFQVSLQPGNYSQVYSCVGTNQISGEITGHKNNDLLKNANTYTLKPNTTYFFDIDVDNNGNTTVKPINQNDAMAYLKDMHYQSHQITRVVPNCPITVQPVAIIAPIKAPIQHDNIDLNVLFDNDKAVVKPQYYKEVKKVADFMQQHPEINTAIKGYTDNNASEAYNLALSQQRIDTSKAVLLNQFHIESNRLTAIDYGKKDRS